jgi:hypothetical protein
VLKGQGWLGYKGGGVAFVKVRRGSEGLEGSHGRYIGRHHPAHRLDCAG